MPKQLVLLDNCVWNLLYERKVDLLVEQADDLEFNVSDLGWLEIPSPDHTAAAVGDYARDQLARLGKAPATWFAFAGHPRAAGFGDLQPDGSVVGGGYLASVEGQAYKDDDSLHRKVGGITGDKPAKSGLLKNETDVDYGDWSFSAPVVTDNIKDFKNAGRVIPLSAWTSGNFGDFVRANL